MEGTHHLSYRQIHPYHILPVVESLYSGVVNMYLEIFIQCDNVIYCCCRLENCVFFFKQFECFYNFFVIQCDPEKKKPRIIDNLS